MIYTLILVGFSGKLDIYQGESLYSNLEFVPLNIFSIREYYKLKTFYSLCLKI